MPCVLLLFLLVLLTVTQAEPDPCQNYRELNDPHRSTAYLMASTDPGACDKQLPDDWYRFTSGAGGKMPEQCVDRFHCGTLMPIWMNGTHPRVDEGQVVRNACANFHGGNVGQPCCEHQVNIAVKNCSGFFVYFLRGVPSCPIAYCAGDKLQCPAGSRSPTGFSPCLDAYPALDQDPVLSEPQVGRTAFRFNCDVSHAGHESNAIFEVQWTFDGQPDDNIPSKLLTGNERQAFLPGTALQGHLGQEVGCRVRSWYSNTTTSEKSPWRDSNRYWAGIQIEPKQVEVSEKGDNQTVTVTSTVPIVCDYDHNTSCCLYFFLHADGPQNNVVTSQTCQQKLCAADWDVSSHTASTTITVAAAKDQIRDGDNKNTMLLAFNRLQPGGSGPYLNVFNNYTIDPVQVNVKDEPTRMCSWSGDPHFCSFIGRPFQLFDVGDFTAYHCPEEGFELQTRTRRCSNRVSCQCGLAIREHNDVIRIDNCAHPSHAPRVETSRQPLRQGTSIHRSGCGRHIMVYMPSGRQIRVDVGNSYHNVQLTVPGTDTGRGRGVCGNLDGGKENEFTHRDGTTQYQPCRNPWNCIPRSFTESWRNPQSASLFETPPNTTNRSATDVHYCQCDTSSSINCTANVAQKAQRCGSSSCQEVTSNLPQILQDAGDNGWSRRDVLYADLDEPDLPVNFTNTSPDDWSATWPTASGITEAEARQRCRQEIENSQLYKHCGAQTSLTEINVQRCVTDVLYGNNYDMVESSLAAFTAGCQFELMQEPSNYQKDSQGQLVLNEAISQVCSQSCLRNGHCIKGQCVCNTGFTGDNCLLIVGQPATLHRIRGPSDCDLNQRPCRKIYFDADHFQMTDNFKCKVDTVLPGGQLSGHPVEEKAQFISGIRLACPIPDSAGGAVTKFAVSVTFDGQIYSNIQYLTIYDSTCQSCANHECTQKPDTCLINNQCHQKGNYKIDDATKICDPTTSSSDWTTSTSPGRFPDIQLPLLTGPDTDFLLTCAIQSTSHVSSSRFEVTWYSDIENVIARQTLADDEREATLNLFDIPAYAHTVHCEVRSFYEGQTLFSPSMVSSRKQLQTV